MLYLEQTLFIMRIKNLLPLLIIVLFVSKTVKSQVNEVSIIISPTLNYNFNSSKSTLDNGLFYGFQAGFGFGKFIELRGIYEHSLDFSQSLNYYKADILANYPNYDFNNKGIKVARTGGEFKANIPIGTLSPYLLFGTGIQSYKRENPAFTNEDINNLYASFGVGLKLNITKRLTLNIEGRGTRYNLNPSNLIYMQGGGANFEHWINSLDYKPLYNWGLMTSVQLYLGGRDNSQLSEMDKAYLNKFSSGLSGIKYTFAPSIAYVNFNNKSGFRSTYLLGAIGGIGLTDYIGLSAYYYRASKNEIQALNFDRMAMYGVDFVGKLNIPRGIVPYITLGAGYLNALNGYAGKTSLSYPNGIQPANSAYYAKAGFGLAIPLGKRVSIDASTNILLTTDDTHIANLSNSESLRTHQMHSVGIRVKFGKSAKTNDSFNYNYKTNAYDQRVATLKTELNDAYDKNDMAKIDSILKEKKSLSETNSESTIIKMTPAELERLILKTLKAVDDETSLNIESRIENIELLLLRKQNGLNTPRSNNFRRNFNDRADSVKLDSLQKRIPPSNNQLFDNFKKQSKQIDSLQSEVKALTEKIKSLEVKPVVKPSNSIDKKKK